MIEIIMVVVFSMGFISGYNAPNQKVNYEKQCNVGRTVDPVVDRPRESKPVDGGQCNMKELKVTKGLFQESFKVQEITGGKPIPSLTMEDNVLLMEVLLNTISRHEGFTSDSSNELVKSLKLLINNLLKENKNEL